MSQPILSKTEVIRAAFLVVALVILAAPLTASAQDMTIAPHRIVLNAVGQSESVQAVIRTPIQPGYALSDYSLVLKFNGVTVSEAYDLYYCVIDDNFLASFDRAALLANPVVQAMANTTVTATVEGWFSAEDGDGNTYAETISCAEQVQIVKPGKSTPVKLSMRIRSRLR